MFKLGETYNHKSFITGLKIDNQGLGGGCCISTSPQTLPWWKLEDPRYTVHLTTPQGDGTGSRRNTTSNRHAVFEVVVFASCQTLTDPKTSGKVALYLCYGLGTRLMEEITYTHSQHITLGGNQWGHNLPKTCSIVATNNDQAVNSLPTSWLNTHLKRHVV